MRDQPVEKGTPWNPGTVKHVLNDQSYIVSTDGYDARRNRMIFENENVLMGRWWQILNKIRQQLQILEILKINLFEEAVEQSNHGKE